MAGGGKVRIIDNLTGESARVVDGRLLVSSVGGGGAGGDINIAEVGGVAVGGPSVPINDGGNVITVDGTVSVSNFPATQAVTQSTIPWITSGVMTANGSVVDAANSSIIPLVGGGNFTGAWTNLLGFSTIALTVNTDADSGTDEMLFEFSTNAVDVDDSYPFNFTANEPRRFQFDVTAKFFRVNYTSRAGAPGNQTFFRLQVILHTTDLITSIHRLDQDVNPDRSATLVQAAIMARANGTGDFINIQANPAGILKVTTQENVRIMDGVGAELATVKVDNAVIGANPTGLVFGGEVKTPSTAITHAVGDLAVARFDRSANLLVTNFMRDPVFTSNICNVLCTGDSAGELTTCGIAPMFVMDAAPTVASSSFSHGFISNTGRILVETKGADMTTIALSGGTRGRPIAVVATATLGTTLHVATTTAGELDRIYIDLTNTSASGVLVTIEFGVAGSEIDIWVPANETVHAIEGAVLGGAATDTITAYADTASVVNAFGRVERLAA